MIPFIDLKAQIASIRPEIDVAIARVLDTCQFTLGQEVELFEQEFAQYCSVDHAIGVNSGTSALHLALLAAGVGPGDEVITVPHTFVATIAAICYTGARPVLVDIDSATMNIDVNKIEAAITKQTKVILPVHLYGQPADMDPIMEIAHKHGLIVIEDAAQAHGAEYRGRRTGSIGDLACFSFYPGKNLGACGEGGMVTTNTPQLARKIRMLRDWGTETKYHHELLGYNYRMEGIQGAVLRVKLRHVEQWTNSRRIHAERYHHLLSGHKILLPAVRKDVRHVYHLYVVRLQHRFQAQQFLTEAGIQTGIHYPIPVHLQPGFKNLGYAAGAFPHAEKAANEILSLPIFAELSLTQINEVVSGLTTFLDITKKS